MCAYGGSGVVLFGPCALRGRGNTYRRGRACHAMPHETHAENASQIRSRYIGRIYSFNCVIGPLARSLGKLIPIVTGQR